MTSLYTWSSGVLLIYTQTQLNVVIKKILDKTLLKITSQKVDDLMVLFKYVLGTLYFSCGGEMGRIFKHLCTSIKNVLLPHFSKRIDYCLVWWQKWVIPYDFFKDHHFRETHFDIFHPNLLMNRFSLRALYRNVPQYVAS